MFKHDQYSNLMLTRILQTQNTLLKRLSLQLWTFFEKKILFFFWIICKSRIKLCFHNNLSTLAENCMEKWIIL